MRRRRAEDPRQVALDAYLRELKDMDPDYLVGLVPKDPGFWGIPELSTRKGEVDLGVCALQPFEPPADLQFVAMVRAHRAIYRVFADGFVVRRTGEIEPLSDENWAFWNI